MLSQDHMHTKHINVTYHFIHEKVASHKAALTYIPTKDNIADQYIKQAGFWLMSGFRSALVSNASAQHEPRV